MDEEPLRELETTTEVFAALGGINAVASLTGRKYSAAFNWKALGRFPSDTFVVLQEELRAARCSAPASLWGMVERPPESVEARA